MELPVYVYGTLRPGEGNWSLLDGRATHLGRARLAGHALYASGGLPFAVPDPARQVIGDLVEINADIYNQVLGDLDRLEGYRPGRESYLYDRREVEVELEHGARPRRAWAYIARAERVSRLGRHRLVPSGDWLVHRHRAA